MLKLAKILKRHKSWLHGRMGGKRAGLSNANLDSYDLRRANLSKANLSKANLSFADLTGCDLRKANLRGAILRSTELSGCDLRGADLPNLKIPEVPDIDGQILCAVLDSETALDMSDWHTCETTHCRAGWAVTLAGKAGVALERRVGPSAAGALIYAVSRPDRPVPDFMCSNQRALESIIDDAVADLG